MLRRIIEINEEKCTGCGICVNACHEGAIGLVDGKAKLLRDDYCDGLGDCLPNCPTGAISFIEKDTLAYDENAVFENRQKKKIAHTHCPGSAMQTLKPEVGLPSENVSLTSQLSSWPIQIKLAPVNAPYFQGAKLLIAADCSAYAYANFHNRFMKNRVTLIGCPKLDGVDYSEKLTQIIQWNEIQSVTIVRMEVPCCGGLENAVKKALQNSKKLIPWQVVTISIDGKILED